MINNDEPRSVDKERVAEFLQITFSAIDQALTIYDENLRLVAWNEQYEQLGIMPPAYIYYGASLPEAYKLLAQAGAFGPGDPELLADFHTSALRDGPLIENELMLLPDGRKVRIRRFALSNGGVCATLSDVTKEMETQEQLRQSAKMDAIGRLTGGFAHDMNNVLAAVIGNIELEQLSQNGTTNYLSSALEAAQRGAELTHRLLAFARKQPLSPEVISPAPLLANVTSMLKPLLGETIAVDLKVDPEIEYIKVDKTQLESVLVNLAINASDAMPDGGRISLTASNINFAEEESESHSLVAGRYVNISVTDTGIGMDHDTATKAFEPFFTTKPPGTGTGLGLAMAHGFIHQSNGHIEICSQPENGTTIEIYLPATTLSDTVKILADDLSFEDPEASAKHILVVEDDMQLRETLVNMLKLSGYIVVTARDGIEARAALQGPEKFDVILTDVVLPNGANGRDVADQALALRPNIAPILMSGHFEGATSRQRYADSDITVLQKPFRRQDIIREIVKATKKGK